MFALGVTFHFQEEGRQLHFLRLFLHHHHGVAAAGYGWGVDMFTAGSSVKHVLLHADDNEFTMLLRRVLLSSLFSS